MFSRSLGAAVTVTVVAALPLYFIIPAFTAITPLESLWLLLALLPINLASAWLDSRLQRSGPAKGKKPRRRSSAKGKGNARERGNVKWFNAAKGFGFITRDAGDDVFVHFRGIRGRGRRVLRDGQRVEFSVNESPKGLQADDVATLE